MKLTAKELARSLKIQDHIAATSLRERADHMQQVMGFHSLYNVPMQPLQSEDPRFEHMDDARVAMRVNLILEEVLELMLDGLGVAAEFRTCNGKHILEELAAGKRDGAAVADALGDIVYVCYGFALELGYDLRDVIDEIHASNLTKLGEDGLPLVREDGKVLKGPNYMPPNISAALGWEDEA